MQARVDEIADDIFRISVNIPEMAPGGFTFNHFIVRADEPLLFHCGMRNLFPAVSEAIAKLLPFEHLRWISFGHVEGDECGSMNQWLGAAPFSEVTHGTLACELGLSEMADRAPKALADGQVLDLGGKKIRFLATPHVPHSWDAGVMFEETTGTLLCGDLFAHAGNGVLTENEIVTPAIEGQKAFMGTAVTTLTAPTLRRLAELNPSTLALMHGSSFHGNGKTQLEALADYYENELELSIQDKSTR